MFIVRCDCHAPIETSSSQFNEPLPCSECGRTVFCVSAEPIDDISASADFDATLLVVAGSTREAQLIALGGCVPITIGSAEGNRVILIGEGVGPSHCKLVRIDFGPSRWKIEDLGSQEGLTVNGELIGSRELQPGDTIQIGEYELRYNVAPAEVPDADDLNAIPVAMPAGRAAKARKVTRIETNGPMCPSCLRRLGHGAKICVECGIHIDTGRPLLTSQSFDENTVYASAETAVTFASWLLWVTPLPIPLASEAYGKFKPYAIWFIAAVTIISSMWFLVAGWNGNTQTAADLMLRPANPDLSKKEKLELVKWEHLPMISPARTRYGEDGSPHFVTILEARADIYHRLHLYQFHKWQLVTYAFLHDPDSLFGFILRLSGNMLFLIVFGSRVNAIIGNRATLVIYPLLACAAGLAYLYTVSPDDLTPLVGASGAINGLAGIYLVLLPAHYVYCAMWARFGRQFAMTIFPLRGFWLLLIYFTYDVLMVAISKQDDTAHWAHIGGFCAGVIVGILLLVSQAFDVRNGDLLSLMLGKRAWPLIGKPSRWAVKTVPL